MAKPERVTANGILAITPSDSTNLSKRIYQLYVGGTGNIVVVADDGSEATLSSVPAGTIFKDIKIRRIKATNTTATNMVGFY